MGELKKIAKEIKKDHDLAMALWGSGEFQPRLLSVLIMDKKQLTQDVLDMLANDLMSHNDGDRARISEWLLANQLMKDKNTRALLESWEHHESPTLRRLFWYHQGRLRWTGQTPPDNTVSLLDALDQNLAREDPEVQWAMNFTAGWIGVQFGATGSSLYNPTFSPSWIQRVRCLGSCTPIQPAVKFMVH